MNVCIIGDGLAGLTLAKALVNQGIYVELFSSSKNNYLNESRTLGISKANVDFINKKILNIEKILWDIKKIEIYSENLQNEVLLNFEKKTKLFSIIKNNQFYKILISELKKSNYFKKINDNRKIVNKNYKLIINCDKNSLFTKKYFSKKLNKDYKSYAHTTIIEHKKLLKNNIASQIFTKIGPLAFLPISEEKTSVIYSIRGSKNINLEKLIKKYNTKYSISKINPISIFELKSVNLRNYYFENILAFGDLLHKIHPLAGQGFNMTLRDIESLLNLIVFRLDHGLDLDSSICVDFEKKTKHKNYLFSQGIDFIYEFFKIESKTNNQILSKTVQYIAKNKFANKFFTEIANNGIVI
tara:strand:- start:467 stop:1531 length:1065 start_codon:yes stop_codon:yes gene_type:complete